MFDVEGFSTVPVCVWAAAVAAIIGPVMSVCVEVEVSFLEDIGVFDEGAAAAACAYVTGPAAFLISKHLRASGKEMFFSL